MTILAKLTNIKVLNSERYLMKTRFSQITLVLLIGLFSGVSYGDSDSPPPNGLMGGSIQGKPLNMSLNRTVSTIAGSKKSGAVDGIGKKASFWNPYGITTDGTNLYVADSTNRAIRKIVISTGMVSTLASARTVYTDGIAFEDPISITTDGKSLYIVDMERVRKVEIATGAVSTLAGSGDKGEKDGIGSAATFNRPSAITTDGTNLYVLDDGNGSIRKIKIDTGAVSTLAGGVGRLGMSTTEEPFGVLSGITTDGKSLYVIDNSKSRIRKIVIASGTVSTLLIRKDRFSSSIGYGLPPSAGITTDGVNLYMADLIYNKIYRIVIATSEVVTLAGSGKDGAVDSVGTAASFSGPMGLTTDGSNLYVTEFLGHQIRKIQ